MKLVVDMNLSPAWIDLLQSAGHAAVHWSTIEPHRSRLTVLPLTDPGA